MKAVYFSVLLEWYKVCVARNG